MTAIGVTAVVAIALLGSWSMNERGTEPRTSDADADALAIQILGADGSVPEPDDSLVPEAERHIRRPPGGATKLSSRGADAGFFGSEQPPPDYQGEITDPIDYEPEVAEPTVPPGVVQLTEAQLAQRRQQQAERIDHTIAALNAQIERARDQGNESMVNLLERRQRRLRQRRDTLAEM